MDDKKSHYLPITISCISLIVTCIFGYLLLNEKNKFADFEMKYLSQKEAVNEVKNGKDGINGIDGKDGANGIDGKDGKDGKDGLNGKDGKTPELREYNGVIQWKYKEEENWDTLLQANDSSSVKGLVQYKKSFKTKYNGYVNLGDITPITNGENFASVEGESIKLTAGHYYYVSLVFTSNGASSGKSSAYIYNGNEIIATAFNWQDATSIQPTDSTSTIFLSNGTDLKIKLGGLNSSYDTYINLELTIVNLGE